MHKRFGLGLPDFLPSLKVFMPFFIELTLPFSVKRGEFLKQDIYVYNYLLESQVVTVTVDRNDAEFTVLQPDTTSWQGLLSYQYYNYFSQFYETFFCSNSKSNKLHTTNVSRCKCHHKTPDLFKSQQTWICDIKGD